MAAAMRLASISQLCSAIPLPFWDVAWGAAINILMAYCCDGMGLPARVGSHPAAGHQSRQLWSPRLQPGAAHRRFPWPRARVPPATAAARPPAQCVVCIFLPNEGGCLVGRGAAGFATWGSLGELSRRGPSIPPALVASATAMRRPPPLSPAPRPRSPCHCCRPPAWSMRAGAVGW
ncbi:hypothetical protein B0H14DRAFT_2593900 [Mycena olivaceomarginata]|nr:hypothetical protein B0H14DRAFT_2593900 [Mycena olivaceomarginata]